MHPTTWRHGLQSFSAYPARWAIFLEALVGSFPHPIGADPKLCITLCCLALLCSLLCITCVDLPYPDLCRLDCFCRCIASLCPALLCYVLPSLLCTTCCALLLQSFGLALLRTPLQRLGLCCVLRGNRIGLPCLALLCVMAFPCSPLCFTLPCPNVCIAFLLFCFISHWFIVFASRCSALDLVGTQVPQRRLFRPGRASPYGLKEIGTWLSSNSKLEPPLVS